MTAAQNMGQEGAEVKPTLPQVVGVLGGGRMGAGIAHAFLMAGCRVVIVERDHESVASAAVRVERSVGKSFQVVLKKSADKERASDCEADAARIMKRLRLTTDYTHLGPCGLVVEAVPEVWAMKTAALVNAEKQLAPSAFLASNTSSLSVSRLAGELKRPENFLGLHFFNPVPASTLVEVVIANQSAPALVDTAKSWVAALGKTAVVVNDAPGFASSRLGVVLALEAMRMVEENVASAADIDAAMVLGYKHATGPLRTTDLVGLDVRLEIAEYLAETLGERFAPPQILRDKVARGELGRKSGTGFFNWD